MSNEKFKVGDKVSIRKDLKGGEECGYFTFTTNMFKQFEGSTLTIASIFVNGYKIEEDHKEYSWTDEMFEPAKGYKPKPITHLVQWDLEGCGDPVKAFTNEKDAKDFIKELSDTDNVKKDSIVLYTIKSAQEVVIQKTLRLKQKKI